MVQEIQIRILITRLLPFTLMHTPNTSIIKHTYSACVVLAALITYLSKREQFSDVTDILFIYLFLVKVLVALD